jgi:hypothetical protein
VSADYSSARILVRHSMHSSQAFRDMLDDLNGYMAREIDPGLNPRATGESVLINRSVDYIATGQAKSLLVMSGVIFALIAVLFLNARVGLLAVVPNIFPIVVLFGVMGYAGIPMDIGTAMVAAIAIGICVDNTIHLMVRYQRELREQGDESEAMFNTIGAEVVPIGATAVSLALGFATLTLSGFAPVVYFGALSAMVMLLSLLANFFITPVMLRATHLITVWDMLSVRLRSELSARNEMFRDMRPWHIRRIMLFGRVRRYRAGEVIFRQGQAASDIFILLEGQVELRIHHPGGRIEVCDRLSQGRLLGETALLAGSERLAEAVATADCRVLSIRWQTLLRVARIHPYLTSLMYRNLALAVGRRFSERVRRDEAPPG